MKKSSLQLVFESSSSDNHAPISIRVETGYDLRQDMLVLDAIRWMKVVWRKESLDLQMTPYGCVATGIDSGLFELVTPAVTTAQILSVGGGGVFSSLRSTALLRWLSNSAKEQRISLAKVVANFTHSCAGYCVVR